jgi:murein DD-endopeptidase MepM/ murein hydrolase activator NlpD
MSTKMAESGGIGLGDMLYEQLKATTEETSRVTSPSRALNPKEIKPLRAGIEANKQSPLAVSDSSDPLYTPLEENADEQGDAGAVAATGPTQSRQNGQNGQRAGAEQGSGPLLDQVNVRAALAKPAAQRYNRPLGQTGTAGARSQTTNAVGYSGRVQTAAPQFPAQQGPTPQSVSPFGGQALSKAFGQSPVTQAAPQTSIAAANAAQQSYQPYAQTLQVNPEDLSAVNSLEGDLTQPAPIGVAQPSPVTAAPPRTQLRPAQNQTQTYQAPVQKQGPTPTPGASQQQSDSLERLDSGIRNKQGALPNEGGPEPSSAGRMTPLLATTAASLTNETVSYAKGPLVWPVNGDVTSGYGVRRSAFTGEIGAHEGVDLAANHGDPVKACWDGKVIFSGEQEGYGKLVVLDHGDGWRSYYGHNSANAAQVGDVVRAGSFIARAGSTGNSTGTHVHFELRHNDAAVDPMLVEQRFQASRTGRAS